MLSSEYFIIEQCLLMALRSSVNMVKMFGPPTVPCEHPVCIGSCGYCVLLKNSPCERLMLKSKSHFCMFPEVMKVLYLFAARC